MALGNPFQPAGLGAVGGLATDVGGRAQGLLRQRVPGVSKVRQANQALGMDPNIALPGGGSLDMAGDTRFGGGGQDVLQRLLAQEEPAATRPMYQAEQQRRQALAGVLGGASGLGAEASTLGTQFGMKTQENLQNFLYAMGLGVGPSKAGAGGYSLLTSLLGIV